ncbi:MAG TPA: response regulator [Candidatus Binatia bacterium]|nr:response regulator [Candidatus Binatia bacterium]
MRVLIVDDDPTFCQLLAEVLENKGMQVVWTTDGLLGYEKSLYESYDLFILDERMPLVLGTELVEDLKRDNPQAKVILISAFADEALQRRSQNLGVPLLSKPFAAERLLEVVRGALGSSIKQGNSNPSDANNSPRCCGK